MKITNIELTPEVLFILEEENKFFDGHRLEDHPAANYEGVSLDPSMRGWTQSYPFQRVKEEIRIAFGDWQELTKEKQNDNKMLYYKTVIGRVVKKLTDELKDPNKEMIVRQKIVIDCFTDVNTLDVVFRANCRVVIKDKKGLEPITVIKGTASYESLLPLTKPAVKIHYNNTRYICKN